MTNLEIAARLLQAVPNDCYCATCLASALQVRASMAADIAAILGRGVGCQRGGSVCIGCGHLALTIVYVPVECVRCSQVVDEADLVIARGDRFHRHCWQILESAKRVADSRQMTRLSHELVRRSLERLKLQKPS